MSNVLIELLELRMLAFLLSGEIHVEHYKIHFYSAKQLLCIIIVSLILSCL